MPTNPDLTHPDEKKCKKEFDTVVDYLDFINDT